MAGDLIMAGVPAEGDTFIVGSEDPFTRVVTGVTFRWTSDPTVPTDVLRGADGPACILAAVAAIQANRAGFGGILWVEAKKPSEFLPFTTPAEQAALDTTAMRLRVQAMPVPADVNVGLSSTIPYAPLCATIQVGISNGGVMLAAPIHTASSALDPGVARRGTWNYGLLFEDCFGNQIGSSSIGADDFRRDVIAAIATTLNLGFIPDPWGERGHSFFNRGPAKRIACAARSVSGTGLERGRRAHIRTRDPPRHRRPRCERLHHGRARKPSRHPPHVHESARRRRNLYNWRWQRRKPNIRVRRRLECHRGARPGCDRRERGADGRERAPRDLRADGCARDSLLPKCGDRHRRGHLHARCHLFHGDRRVRDHPHRDRVGDECHDHRSGSGGDRHDLGAVASALWQRAAESPCARRRHHFERVQLLVRVRAGGLPRLRQHRHGASQDHSDPSAECDVLPGRSHARDQRRPGRQCHRSGPRFDRGRRPGHPRPIQDPRGGGADDPTNKFIDKTIHNTAAKLAAALLAKINEAALDATNPRAFGAYLYTALASDGQIAPGSMPSIASTAPTA